MVWLLTACGLFGDGQKSESSEGGAPPNNEVPVPSVSFGYDGPTLLEQRILASSVIVRVQLQSATSTVESGTTYLGMKYFARLEFRFSVLEYLKGSGGGDIVAVWDAAPLFDTRQEAEAALPTIAAARDTQWDDREAIVLFRQEYQEFLQSTQQADRYYLSWGGSWSIPDDGYSIASIHDKLWLPAASASSQLGGDGQRFLVDVPSETGEAPTITLGEVKAKIAAVTAKLSGSDGSEEYMTCVQQAYERERRHAWRLPTLPQKYEGDGSGPPARLSLSSGAAAGTVVHEVDTSRFHPDAPHQNSIEGVDAELFQVGFTDPSKRLSTTRPLPGGQYTFFFNNRWGIQVKCEGYTNRYEITVTTTAPDGTLHEAFFDPVTVGNAVAADGANGVLKPATFTGTNGATTTIERIAWEAGTGELGTVKIRLSPHTGIASHAVDFIALDGSVSLSLDVANATVDAASNTLSWPVASRPWQNGDELMVRIREAL